MLNLAGVFVVGFFIVYSSAFRQEETTSTPHVDSNHIKINEIFIDGKSFVNDGQMSKNFQKDNDAFLANLLAQISDFKMDKDLLKPRSKMVRNRKRKSTKGLSSETAMRAAVEEVEKGKSLRKAAENYGVDHVTLYRYVQKKKKMGEIPMIPNYANRRIFSVHQESSLEEYLIVCSKMCYGLDTIETRRKAYIMAKHLGLQVPANWEEKKMAGIDWLFGFRQRHPNLRLRKPEACSLSRATSFNRHNVQMFYANLRSAIAKHPSFGDGTRVFSLDETGTKTVQKPRKVFASKTAKQLNKVTSAERGTLVTTCCIVSAAGTALPPAFVFPRKNFQSHMLTGAPTGSIGLAHNTGWMTSELFVEVMRHFIKLSSSTKENPSLVIMDNHESHLAPEVLNIAKENGVMLLTIPPHTSHKLQALDVSVFGPFQNYYNKAADSWMMRHPGQTITIYNVAELVAQAFEKAMTPSNIKSGFKKTGIFPFDEDIFTEDDYLSSEVTNRPLPTENLQKATPLQSSRVFSEEPQPSTSKEQDPDVSLAVPGVEGNVKFMDNVLKSPIECLDYPRANPRKCTGKRKRGQSLILTDTPIKMEIEERARERNEKKMKKMVKPKADPERKKKERVTKALFLDIDEKNEKNAAESSNESSDTEDDEPLCTHKTPKANDFVVVKFEGKLTKHFVGQILTDMDDNNEYDITYLRRSAKVDNSFYYPLEPDLAMVSIIDIECVLPRPNVAGKTKRQSNIYSFPGKILKNYCIG